VAHSALLALGMYYNVYHLTHLVVARLKRAFEWCYKAPAFETITESIVSGDDESLVLLRLALYNTISNHEELKRMKFFGDIIKDALDADETYAWAGSVREPRLVSKKAVSHWREHRHHGVSARLLHHQPHVYSREDSRRESRLHSLWITCFRKLAQRATFLPHVNTFLLRFSPLFSHLITSVSSKHGVPLRDTNVHNVRRQWHSPL
jgi:hypothetical protein